MKALRSSGFVILACIWPFVMTQLEGPSTSSDTETDTLTSTLGPSPQLVTSSEANEVEVNSQEPDESGPTTERPSISSEAPISNIEAEVPNTPPPTVENEMESNNIHNETSTSSPHPTTTPTTTTTTTTTSLPNEDSTIVAEIPLTTTTRTIETSVLTTQHITTTSGENLAETSSEVTEEPTTTASPVSSSTVQQENVPAITDAPQTFTESSTQLDMEVLTEGNDIISSSEIPHTTGVTEASQSTTEKVDNVSLAQESTTETSSTTVSSIPITMKDNTSKAENITETTEGSTEQAITMKPETTKTSEGIAEASENESSMGSCFSKAYVNTILIIAIVVGVNVLSVIVTAICVHRLVSRRLSWDPPPMHYSKKKPAGGHPLAAPRTAGIHLATDTDCRAGENPATQIPIVITNEDGWCVPYSDQDKKKKNSSDKNTEDTGV